jgi:hypothetical protein
VQPDRDYCVMNRCQGTRKDVERMTIVTPTCRGASTAPGIIHQVRVHAFQQRTPSLECAALQTQTNGRAGMAMLGAKATITSPVL